MKGGAVREERSPLKEAIDCDKLAPKDESTFSTALTLRKLDQDPRLWAGIFALTSSFEAIVGDNQTGQGTCEKGYVRSRENAKVDNE
jgi:hypothetical protein